MNINERQNMVGISIGGCLKECYTCTYLLHLMSLHVQVEHSLASHL